MMRSMFSGVSGLRTHQTRMDVIGNNIANVNTIGFKGSRATFQEIFSQTLRGAGAPTDAGRGGTNPMQIGLGIGLSSIDTLTTRGSVQRTDYPYDVAIDGEGFFVLKDSGGGYKFSRAGNFGLDKTGNLVSASGLQVYGWRDYTHDITTGKYDFNTEKPMYPINFYYDESNGNKRIFEASPTKNARMTGNLDSSFRKVANFATKLANPHSLLVEGQDDFFKLPMTNYDSLGNEYNIEVYFVKTATATIPPVAPATTPTYTTTWQMKVVKENDKDNFGISEEIFTDSDDPATAAGRTTLNTVTFDGNGNYIAGTGAQYFEITPNADAGTQPIQIKLDLNGLTSYASESSAKPSFVDGYKSGTLYNFSIGGDGVITGMYDNGQQKPLGMIALAMFENPSGLMKAGENLFSETVNSGVFSKGVKAGAGGTGALSPGTLEMSNVDLSKEFTEMIITQRGFQANSRIITTSDEMLQELVNLKR